MNKSLHITKLLLLCLIIPLKLCALSNYLDIYPGVIQSLVEKGTCPGDRHGSFQGDPLAILSDGSEWKIHPTQSNTFASWQEGDKVRIKVRTDWYWFKREHKFALYNYDREESLKVMLITHRRDPFPLQVVYTETNFQTTDNKGRGTDPRKFLMLNDGSSWIIKDNFDAFLLNTKVYIGVQGVPGKFYDFILISGTEREAIWTYARPPRP